MGPAARRRLHKLFIIFCGEFIATAFLMIYGCAGINDRQLYTTHAALAWAFAVTAIITSFGHLTACHINPSVTTCFLILGFIGPSTALVYYVAEILGAIFGFYIVLIITQDLLLSNVTNPDAGFCMTIITPGVTVFHGFLCEFIATSFLIFAVCSITDRRNSMWGDAVPIKIGFTVGVLVFGAGPFTGASMNPARSFAPALIYNKWKDHWIYWAGTLGGSICTSLLYKYLFSPRTEEEVIIRIAKPAGPEAAKGAIIVDANSPQIGEIKMKSSEVLPRLETEIAIQEEPTSKKC